jgi:hypothetical protein
LALLTNKCSNFMHRNKYRVSKKNFRQFH